VSDVPEIRTCLGFIETVGLSAAMEAADAALKAANVTLIGRENSRGNGCMTIKIAGEVGAVKAALAAAKAAASKVTRVWSLDVIPRPGAGVGPMLSYNRLTLGARDWLDRRTPRPEPPSDTTPEGPRGTPSPEPEPEPGTVAASLPEEPRIVPLPSPEAAAPEPEAPEVPVEDPAEISCEPLLESAEAQVLICEAGTLSAAPEEEPLPETEEVPEAEPEREEPEARIEALERPEEPDGSDEEASPDGGSSQEGGRPAPAEGASRPSERKGRRPRRRR